MLNRSCALRLGRYARAVLVVIVAAGLLVVPVGTGTAGAAPVAPQAAAPRLPSPVPYVTPQSSKPLHGQKANLRDLLRPEWRPKAPPGGWSKPGPAPSSTRVASPAATEAGHVGVTDLFAASGDVIGDTAWVVYFNIPESFTSIGFKFFDASTNQSVTFSGSGAPAFGPSCDQRTAFCFTLTKSLGWPLVDGHLYYATITVFYSDNTSVTSGRSNSAPAHTTPVPPALPNAQTIGCAVCNSSAGRTAIGQIMRGDPVNTATGAYEETDQDLSMPSFGVPFSLSRTYSSISTATGSLGKGWGFAYDMKMIGANNTPVFQDENGAQVTFTRQRDGTYTAPPGVRAQLTTPRGAFTPFTLTTPDQRVLRFLDGGRLASITDHRQKGLKFKYNTDGSLATITDAGGRVVTLTTAGGRITKVTLPDGRSVQYGYTGNDLTSVTDPAGGITAYGYDRADRLSTATDANGHRMVLNAYHATTGRVISQTDAAGQVTGFDWDPDLQASFITDPDGLEHADQYLNNVLVLTLDGNFNETTYNYDSHLNVSVVTDPLGNRIPMSYDAAGNVTSAAAPDGSYTEQATYDANDNPLSETDGLGRKTTSVYDQFGSLTSNTDPLGNKTTYTYTDRGQLESITDPRGGKTTFEYDTAGNQVAQTSPLGNRATFTYDGTGRRISQVDPRGNVTGADPDAFRTTFGYDPLDRLISRVDPLGHEQKIRYDKVGNRTATIDGTGQTTTFEYDAANRQTATVDPLNRRSTTAYTPAGRVASQTDATGATTTYTYNVAGQLATMTRPRGNVSGATAANFTATYGYDWDGNLVSTSQPLPGGGTATTSTAYDTLRRPVTVTDPLGHSTRTEYDAAGRISASTDGAGDRTVSGYDEAGRLISLTDPRGKKTSYGYDAAGNRVSQTNPLGATTTETYDADGRLATAVDPRGNVTGADPASFTTTYTYDAAGNQTSSDDPLGHIYRQSYDAAGRQTGTTDPNGHRVVYGYDAADRLTTVTGPASTVPATYVYDVAGQRTSSTDPLGHGTGYGYDPAGRLASVTDPLGRRTDYGYDPDGNLATVVTARGNAAGTPGGAPTKAAGTITNTFDPLDRQTARNAGGRQYAWAYDAANRVAGTTDPSGSDTREYDAADRLTTRTRGTDKFVYAYDPAGNVTSRTYPGGRVITATFDDAGQLSTHTADGGITTFGYDPAGNLTSTALPTANGWTERRGYDRAGELTDVATTRGSPATTLAAYHLTLNGVGYPTATTITRGTTARTDTYTYDATDRLTAVCYDTASCDGAATSIGYGYDAVGNRTSQTRTGVAEPGSTSYTYDAADQLTASTAGTTSTAYGYDADGNMTTAGGRTTSYDLLDQPLSSTAAGTTTSFSYDAAGNRLTAGATTFSWDTANSVPLLATETAGSTVRGYAYDPDGDPLTLATGGKAYSYTHDWLGGVSDLTDPTGTPQYAYTYEPYGGGAGADPAPLTTTAPANPLRYTGAYLDPTGSYYLRARQYDPGTGRFDGTDPATPAVTKPTVSSYAYVDDQPTTLVDPTGECGLKAKLKSLRPHFGKSACEIEDEAKCTPTDAHQEGSVIAADTNCAIANAENAATTPSAAGIYVAILSLPIVLDTLATALEGTSLAGGLTICRQTLARIFSSLGLGSAAAEAESQGGKARGGGGTGAGGARPDAGHKYAASVTVGGRPDGETVFAGHGSWGGEDGFFRVPEGTTIEFYAPHGTPISDWLGLQIEQGKVSQSYETFGPGSVVWDYRLDPPGGLNIMSKSVTVDRPTRLSQLVRPGMGRVHWAACRSVRCG